MKTLMRLFAFLTTCLLLLGGTLQAAMAQGQSQEPVSVAIIQLVSHPSLDRITEGIYEGLEGRGYIPGSTVNIDFQNAEGDMNLLNIIAEQVVACDPDLIFAVTTPVAQALQNATEDIPIVLTAITDPLAGQLVDSLDQPGGNISGVSDQIPMDVQFHLAQALLPEAESIGMLYSTSEDNSEAEITLAKEAAESLGFTVQLEAIHSSLDMPMVAQALAQEVDLIFIGSDNTIASAIDALLDQTDAAGIPVFSPVEDFIVQGAFAGVAMDQADFGRMAGDFAADILEGQAIGDKPIVFAEEFRQVYNSQLAEALGISLGDAFLDSAEDVAGVGGQ